MNPSNPPVTQIPMSVAMSDFAGFLTTDLGEALIASEVAAVDRHLPGLVGYNMLQLSVQKARQFTSAARVGQYIKLGFAPSLDSDSHDNVWADYQTFPIATDCIDIALLHHVLEFSKEPHQLLREADRTLTAGGHMLLLGFNPLSAWPIYQQYARLGNGPAMGHKPIRQGRLIDWLSVLNYDVIHQQSYFYRPPINKAGVLSHLQLLERVGERCHLPFGLFYLVIASKRSFPVNFVRQYWPRRIKTARGMTPHSKLQAKSQQGDNNDAMLE